MFEPFVITNHVLMRYKERVDQTGKDIRKRIKQDLQLNRILRIVNIGNKRHVFTLNGKEFVFKRGGKTWILKTIIKRNRKSAQRAIQTRISMSAA